MANDFLVTGAAKGLGKYLYSQFGGLGLTRENSSDILKSNPTFSTLIHCAFSDPQQGAKTENIELTQSLLKLKADKFIFISSSDIYPDDDKLHTENDIINESSLRSEYGKQKLQCEQMILSARPDALIIRPVTMLSDSIRSRNLQNLIADAQPVLSLTENSTLNLIAAEEILSWIKLAQQQNLSGIFNVVRSEAATIGDLALALEKKPTYGSFNYNVGRICNKKSSALMPSLNEPSLSFFKKWIARQK